MGFYGSTVLRFYGSRFVVGHVKKSGSTAPWSSDVGEALHPTINREEPEKSRLYDSTRSPPDRTLEPHPSPHPRKPQTQKQFEVRAFFLRLFRSL